MKQYRDTRYWVTEGGKLFRHYPKRNQKCSGKEYKGKIYEYYKSKPEWYKPVEGSLDRDGYRNTILCFNGTKTSRIGYHRLVAELYCSGYFKGAHVDHIDNNPLNNHYTNLQWCTPEYNNSKANKLTFPLYSEWSR